MCLRHRYITSRLGPALSNICLIEKTVLTQLELFNRVVDFSAATNMTEWELLMARLPISVLLYRIGWQCSVQHSEYIWGVYRMKYHEGCV